MSGPKTHHGGIQPGKSRASCNVRARGAKAIGVGKWRGGSVGCLYGTGRLSLPPERSRFRHPSRPPSGREQPFEARRGPLPTQTLRVRQIRIRIFARESHRGNSAIQRAQVRVPVAACLFAGRWGAVSVPRSSSNNCARTILFPQIPPSASPSRLSISRK